ncbi:WbqC family protein [Ureibacillus manganicus]|uniref:WbqC family protein n=1 Tax=Ureibacillus manganicus TaxID=1266064 RepID=UPI00068AFD2A|nr:WbqC family protein [Ureibacillus manganicus]
MKVAIHQPNYLPWIGYFDKLDQSDIFVFLDKADVSKGSFLNRNTILSPNGKTLLTVPLTKGEKSIHKVQINNLRNWRAKHWATIKASYKKNAFWHMYKDRFEQIYNKEWDSLSELNISLIELICELLEIDVKFYRESAFDEDFGKSSERIANIVAKLQGKTYISGRGGKKYNRLEDFEEKGIDLMYQNFTHPIYNQVWGENFTDKLSIIDLLFHHGPESLNTIRSTRNPLAVDL